MLGDDAQLDRLRQRLRQAPDDGPAWLRLAQMLAAAEPGPELNHAVEQALRSNPENDEAWRFAVELFARQRGGAAALQWLEATARQNPDLAAPQSVLGDRRRQAQDWSGAAEAYHAARRLRPGDAGLANNLGSCLASLWDFEAARSCFEAALKLQPDFPEARLNLALLQAGRLESPDALREIEAVLGMERLASETREAATRLCVLLGEQIRLQPAIESAIASGQVQTLQSALQRTPDSLCQGDGRSLYLLDRLAAACRSLDVSFGQARADDAGHWALVEAWTQCKLPEEQLPDVARQFAANRGALPESVADDLPALQTVLQAIRDRAERDIADLSSEQGEAWLRYWHARLLAATPDRLPGQFKAVSNAIGGRYVTPPEFTVGTVRHLLHTLRPRIPAGLPRALFVYASILGIHPFGDGNGRLARFLLAWEMEAGGGAALIVPRSLRTAAGEALAAAWLDADLGPMLDNLRASREAIPAAQVS